MFSYPPPFISTKIYVGGNMLQLPATVAGELVGCGEGPSL